MCATEVQLVLVGAGGAVVVLEVLLGVVVVVVVEMVEVLLTTGGAAEALTEWMVVVVGVTATGVATSRDGRVTADWASSPFGSGPELQPKNAVAETTASARRATRRGRATSRV
jgi:hypothetical protein